MNRFPLWKYLLLIVVIGFGFLYALPNIYPQDPAIQISGESSATAVDDRVMAQISAALDKAGIKHFGVENDGSSGLVRLHNNEDQLTAHRLIKTELSEGEYIVAVNLATTVPEWLLNLGADRMNYGLDLQGGVHFLYQVDIDKVIKDEINNFRSLLQNAVYENKLYGVKLSTTDSEVIVTTKKEQARTKLLALILKDYNQLEYESFTEGDEFKLRLVLSDFYMQQKQEYAINQNIAILRQRVNEIGVSEPIVQSQGRSRIVVELPGIQDTTEAKRILGKTVNLEFRLEARDNTLSIQKEYFEHRDPAEQARYGGAWMERDIIIGGDRVTNARVDYDQNTGAPQVLINLDSRGGQQMKDATITEIGRRMGILYVEYKTRTQMVENENGEMEEKIISIPNKKMISLATIRNALYQQFVITGVGGVNEATDLAANIRLGALAAPMVVIEESTIGPSLGAENIANGVKSVKLGLILVLLFMLAYYRVFGLAANLALAVNLVLIVAIMSVLGATLTLPGIAGIVLTVGMAVDANVLIFSRVREELKNDSPPQIAINSGFDRAFTTIIDANVTTFLVAIILFAIGTGPVKGFAITLAIGILTSMFTAIVGTRAMVNLVYGGRTVNKLHI